MVFIISICRGFVAQRVLQRVLQQIHKKIEGNETGA